MTRAVGFRGVQQGPAERSRDFRGTAIRMVKRLAPQRFLTATVITLSMAGIAIGVIGPRILGHATDLLFNGVIGRQLPAGQSREQAVEAARTRGDGQFAQMLSGMNVTPGQGVDFHAIGMTLALALSLYLMAGMLAWVQARLLNVTVQRTVVALRTDVENKIHRLPLSYFDSRQRGEILSRVTNDVDNIQTSLQMSINQLLSSMLTLVAALAMMLSISPLLAVITLATVPLSLWVTRAIARRSQRLFVAQWANTGKLNAHIEETYSGFTIVKTYGHRAEAEAVFADRNAEVYRSAFGAQFFSGLVSPATAFIGNLSYVAVAVVGGLKVASGGLTLGSIQAFSQYVRQFNQPLTQVSAMYNTLQSGLASAERVFELLDADEETPDPLAAATVPTGSARVEFEDISFGYSPGQPVIEGLSLRVEPGQTVAIVGPTGAGKTTLVNLLMRFYDVDSGRILLDGIDVSTMTRHDLRSRVGMVLQDTWLFGGTIAENIAYGRPDASEEEILEAARAAHVDRFVRTLPDGYDTKIADDGENISAGEKQLITIARAFLARPQLLILDEATSSVDTRTELRIQRAMAELRRDRTSFIIAHRLSTIRDADRIVVMDGGRVTESGTHTELLARHGAYFAMTQS
ncbi:Probable ABC transporter, ATP-binding protein [Mycobacteroides abscessus subsp. massiliense]|uniref:ABC transporter ATP-binding protein n=1 Tax=Mycobacteroides abscessus TaxID=36809 RepID=UPI00078E1D61|nr:ABC transporter ATP-binding protein [Mycobacteroides abscessus]AMU74585.1 ABC transporter ATP-binding protein [Mycobacteroides abscessus]ANO23520.1 ABC transporter ATP-binding protein [Mycobacteroides abscessus]MBN7322235.1 ABC transporter ATP-binding protein [Mycobacteroides abscessus subsp. massiliense]SKD87734.1 Probable ABC transporter, ATP-binding protein [Mycobacteroides abscessus subsp. massiliense]SKD99849.1 Probable ABC transporter, ATP-binding protein [Mycobacteroides abscessus su